MPVLHINTAPRMTQHLLETRQFARDPLVVVDVGARGGFEYQWKMFGDDIRIIGFEPDDEECERLNREAPSNVTYLPVALSDSEGEKVLYVAEDPVSNSLYRSHDSGFDRLVLHDRVRVISETTIRTTTLAAALGDTKPDVIKLDAEGSELDILRGADLRGVSALLTEVRFTNLLYTSALFADIDAFCRDSGFHLFDLDVYRVSRRTLPYPLLYNSGQLPDGKAVQGPTTQGQITFGDALYMRDSRVASNPLKLACLFEIFGLNDCAAEVVVANNLDPALLEFLVPEVKDQRLPYAEYLRRYEAGDPIFRPKPGYRFPETIVGHYDGSFAPSWREPPPEGRHQKASWWARLFRS